MNEWRKKEVWVKDGPSIKGSFRVEVVHWFTPEFSSGDGERFYPRKDHWNVYIYVYPGHPFFDKYDITKNEWEQPDFVGMHGGITWFKVHRSTDGAEVKCIEVGCDYGHYRDDRFEEYATESDAWEVFGDAQGAFDILLGALPPADVPPIAAHTEETEEQP